MTQKQCSVTIFAMMTKKCCNSDANLIDWRILLGCAYFPAENMSLSSKLHDIWEFLWWSASVQNFSWQNSWQLHLSILSHWHMRRRINLDKDVQMPPCLNFGIGSIYSTCLETILLQPSDDCANRFMFCFRSVGNDTTVFLIVVVSMFIQTFAC